MTTSLIRSNKYDHRNLDDNCQELFTFHTYTLLSYTDLNVLHCFEINPDHALLPAKHHVYLLCRRHVQSTR